MRNVVTQEKKAPIADKGAAEMGNLWDNMADREARPRTQTSKMNRPVTVSEDTRRKSAIGSQKRKVAAEALKERKKNGVRLGKVKVQPSPQSKDDPTPSKPKALVAGSKGGEWWRDDSLAPPRRGRSKSSSKDAPSGGAAPPFSDEKNAKKKRGGGSGSPAGSPVGPRARGSVRPHTAPA